MNANIQRVYGTATRRRSVSLIRLMVVGALLFSMPASKLSAQSKDSFAGTWLLSRGKSDFNPPLAFFSRTMIIDAVDNGWKCIIRTVSDRRQTFESTYTARFDGKDVPIDISNLDTVALRRIDANTVERTGKVKDKIVETAVLRLSNDGKALTVTTKGLINGEDYNSTEVFNRQ